MVLAFTYGKHTIMNQGNHKFICTFFFKCEKQPWKDNWVWQIASSGWISYLYPIMFVFCMQWSTYGKMKPNCWIYIVGSRIMKIFARYERHSFICHRREPFLYVCMYLCCMKAIYMYVQFFLIKHLANENMCIYVCIFVCVKDQFMCEMRIQRNNAPCVS